MSSTPGSRPDNWFAHRGLRRHRAGRTCDLAEPVVLEVVDRLLPTNSGRYRIGPHGTERTSEAPALTLDVEVLAMLYLGAWRASALAGIGRLEVTDRPAWCGTLF